MIKSDVHEYYKMEWFNNFVVQQHLKHQQENEDVDQNPKKTWFK